MLNGYKVVVVTPAGRKRYMEILLPYILKEKGVVDEYQIWINTNNEEDIAFFKDLEIKYKKLIKLDYTVYNEKHEKYDNLKIYKFFKNCIDAKTVYLRLDDDIVYLEDNYIEKMVRFRIQNKEPFLVYGNIFNNAVIDSIMQKNGYYPDIEQINYDCLDRIGWEDPESAEKKHRFLLNNYILQNKSFKRAFDTWILKDYERVSINSICWLGDTFKEFEGIVDRDEENWLSVIKPQQIGKPNVINGSAFCIHFSFFTQRDLLDRTDILQKYKQISEKKFKLFKRKK